MKLLHLAYKARRPLSQAHWNKMEQEEDNEQQEPQNIIIKLNSFTQLEATPLGS